MPAEVLWGYIVGVVGLLVGLGGWMRNQRGDTATQATWMGTVNAKLDNIAAELSKMGDVRERVVVLERDMKTAFNKMDELRQAIKEGN